MYTHILKKRVRKKMIQMKKKYTVTKIRIQGFQNDIHSTWIAVFPLWNQNNCSFVEAIRIERGRERKEKQSGITIKENCHCVTPPTNLKVTPTFFCFIRSHIPHSQPKCDRIKDSIVREPSQNTTNSPPGQITSSIARALHVLFCGKGHFTHRTS